MPGSSNESMSARAFRFLVLISALFGTIGRLAISLPKERGWDTLLYFTVQSNVMVCLFLVVDCSTDRRKPKTSSRPEKTERTDQWRVFRQSAHGAITLYILITGLVFNLLLVPGFLPKDFNDVIIFMNHGTTPVLFLLDWMARQKDYKYSPKMILPWLAYPISYLVCGSIVGGISGSFRYFFLDFQTRNIGEYVFGLVLVTAFFLVIAALIVGGNRRGRKRREESA